MTSKWFDTTAWGPSDLGWKDLGWQDNTAMIGDPAATSFRGTQLAVMACATGGKVKTLIWDGKNWKWYDSGFPAYAGDPALFRWIGPSP
jgi:hypothetical protein